MQAKTETQKGIRWDVFIPCFLVIGGAAILGVVNNAWLTKVTQAIFGWLYQWAALGTLILITLLAFSPVGKIRFGGPQAKAKFSFGAWFAMTLTGGIATGLITYGVNEPLIYYGSIYGELKETGVAPFSVEASFFAMARCFYNWTFIPYAMYALSGVIIAYMYYNRKKELSVAASLTPLFGERVTKGFWRSAIDTLSVLAIALSLRCIPQLHGAARKTLEDARRTLEIEMNSCCDNPILWPEPGNEAEISACNADSAYVGIAMDSACLAATMLAKMSERRNNRLIDGNLSGYPWFLIQNPGLNSGVMIPQYTQAGLLNQMRILCTSSVIDNTPSCGNMERSWPGRNREWTGNWFKMIFCVRLVPGSPGAGQRMEGCCAGGTLFSVHKTSPALAKYFNKKHQSILYTIERKFKIKLKHHGFLTLF